MLWRFKQFLTLWLRLFISGESKWSKVRKMIGALAFFGYLRFTVWDIPFIAVQASSPPITIPLGLLIFLIVVVAWSLITAGRAYELAGVPDLLVANELQFEEGVFRLRLLSKQKDLQTTARLLDIVDSDGVRHLSSYLPLELEWTHKANESRVHLAAGFPERVAVASIDSLTGRMAQLRCGGARFKGEIRIERGKSLYFLVSVEHSNRKPIEKWFRFEQTGNDEVKSFPESPPLIPPATLLMTKHD